MRRGAGLLIGIDSRTSVIEAVAFVLARRQIASAAILNRLMSGTDGSARRSLAQIRAGGVQALRGLDAEVAGTLLLRVAERIDRHLVRIYDRLVPAHVQARVSWAPVWGDLGTGRSANAASNGNAT